MNKIFSVYYFSYKIVHLVALSIFAILIILSNFICIKLDNDKVSTIITLLGIMVTFFFFMVERIDPNILEDKFSKTVIRKNIFNRKYYEPTQGRLYKNTIYNLLFTNVGIIFSIFIIYVFDFSNLYLPAFLLSMCYISIGFIFTIFPWMYKEEKH